MEQQSRLRIFTWHVHGSYLFYLSQGDYDIFIPVKDAKTEGYYGRGNTYPFGANVKEIPDSLVKQMEFDLILFQTDENYFIDQYSTLSDEQRNLPKIYLEHDPPWGHPTNTKHPVTDPGILLVHVTHFNRLMWDNHYLKTKVIEHGVLLPKFVPPAKINRGIVVINHLEERGRLLGADLFHEARKYIPLDLVGMGTQSLGIGEILHPDLPSFIAQYRFFFNPIRYTSLGLAVCEAMMMGLPIVGLATTEMSVTIENGFSGFLDTNPNELVRKMKYILAHPREAEQMGENARNYALERFSITRFTSEWKETFQEAIYSSM